MYSENDIGSGNGEHVEVDGEGLILKINSNGFASGVTFKMLTITHHDP